MSSSIQTLLELIHAYPLLQPGDLLIHILLEGLALEGHGQLGLGPGFPTGLTTVRVTLREEGPEHHPISVHRPGAHAAVHPLATGAVDVQVFQPLRAG
jgi:hypothetical protein